MSRRRDERKYKKFWQEGVPFDLRAETQLGFAPFEMITPMDVTPGVLFVTDRRIVFSLIGPRGTFSGYFTRTFKDILLVEKALPEHPGNLMIVLNPHVGDGRKSLMLRPGNDVPEVVAQCEQVCDETLAAWQRYGTAEGWNES